MDVKISTVVSRFTFPFSQLSERDNNDDDSAAPKGGGTRPRPAAASFLPTKGDGMSGAYAYVSAASYSSSSSSHPSPLPARPHALDLARLASRLWNAELQRSSTTGAPTACILHPPPYVFDGQIYRGASVYVLPSGVVRLATYGSATATLRIAGRVRRLLREAYLPASVCSAAEEERRLLRAVFTQEEEEEESGVRCAPRAHQEPDEGVSLAAALAGGGGGYSMRPALSGESFSSVPRTHSSYPGGKVTRSNSREENEEAEDDLAALREVVKIDFIQSMAKPRWCEVAGLREFLFAPQTSTDADEGATEDGDRGQHPAHGRGSPTALAVTRASVNVRGDAPLAWWRWFLSASTEEGKKEQQQLMNSSADGALSAALRGEAQHADDPSASSSSPFAHAEEGAARFWLCAGHGEVPPTSLAAQCFTAYLAHKRRLLAHHVVSFKVRRNSSQNSIQLLLEWNSACPPPQLSRAIASPFAKQEAHTVAPMLLVDVSAAQSTAAVTSTGESSRSAPTAGLLNVGRAAQPEATDAWVTEASAANFFLESTFIAESTAPYSLESTPPVHHIDGGTITSSSGRDSGPAWSSSAERQVSVVMGPGTSSTAAAATPPYLSSLPGTLRAGKRRRAEQFTSRSVEQVSCLLHRTGRVQLSTGTEIAIQQVCEVLLLPFLVARADVVLGC